MKKTEAVKKAREIETNIELKKLEKIRQIEADMDIENRESNRNRARSITVGTSFGGTSEIMMRSDGGRHLWCVMQPVEVVELIHQLSANVGCDAKLTPRKDFASWRDWRVSEAEIKHLNGHVPFINDMAVFQKLGASGFNNEEAKRIMDILAEVKEYANENDNSEILFQEERSDGAPHLMVGKEDNLLHNKVVVHNDKVIHMSGGNGGLPKSPSNKESSNETLATNKPANERKTKRSSEAA